MTEPDPLSWAARSRRQRQERRERSRDTAKGFFLGCIIGSAIAAVVVIAICIHLNEPKEARPFPLVECDQFENPNMVSCVNGDTGDTVVEMDVDNPGCPTEDSCKPEWDGKKWILEEDHP